MSYKLQYSPELDRRYPSYTIKNTKVLKRVIVFSFLAVIVGVILVQSGLLRYCIPGNPDVTTAAFSSLIEQVGHGENISNAIYDFCHEIIQHSS